MIVCFGSFDSALCWAIARTLSFLATLVGVFVKWL